MSVKTGKTPISILTYIAIMSVCFVINLPGIAVAPMEGKLISLLHEPELEVQLLTTLPNFVIIPFVLLTGKLSLSHHKIEWVIGSLIVYLISAICYLFINSLTGLIIISCLLGCANGILIPFAMGFVVNTFYGKYRTRHLGVKSATSNLGVVIGSFVVGILIEGKDWHLPFVVYLAIIIPIIFSYWLKYVPGLMEKEPPPIPQNNETGKTKEKDIEMPRVWALIGNNVGFSFIAMAVIIYLPQMIENMGWTPKLAGELAAVFFIFVLFAGFILLPFVRLFRHFTFFAIGLFLLSGLSFITFVPERWSLYVGSALSGIAFGIFQPFVYDKTSYTVRNPSKNIVALSYVLTALYLAIALEPFVISGICRWFRVADENYFVFRLSFFMAIAYSLLAFFLRNKFGFSVEKAYISEPEKE